MRQDGVFSRRQAELPTQDVLQAMLFVGCVVAEFGSGHDAELSAK
jgi:hypothetical protein